MRDIEHTCYACARTLPLAQFSVSDLRNHKRGDPLLCINCAVLPQSDLALMVLETTTRNLRARYETIAGRKIAKREARQAQYATVGKRCLDCHAHKPVADYDNNARNPDGLQHSCRACKKLYKVTRGEGGLVLWHTVRQAMRDQNDKPA